jgi:biopolymer transport protein ExbD
MRFPQARLTGDEERLLPLINVVFLLLIFFMLAGQVASVEPFRVEPARSASDGLPSHPESFMVMGADGRIALDGVLVNEASLAVAVAERVAEREGAESGPAVRLKADARAEAVRVVGVMEQLRIAGVDRLELLTVPVQP